MTNDLTQGIEDRLEKKEETFKHFVNLGCVGHQTQFPNVSSCPISASGSNFNPRNTACIPVVNLRRIAFLEFQQISAGFKI